MKYAHPRLPAEKDRAHYLQECRDKVAGVIRRHDTLPEPKRERDAVESASDLPLEKTEISRRDTCPPPTKGGGTLKLGRII